MYFFSPLNKKSKIPKKSKSFDTDFLVGFKSFNSWWFSGGWFILKIFWLTLFSTESIWLSDESVSIAETIAIEEINKLQLADIYQLKDAIKQDKSAIEFVFKLCQETEGSKKALQKLKENGANL